MDGKPGLYPIKILESHLDSFGHVNNAVYLKMFEEARWDYITDKGYGLEQVLAAQKGPVILEVKVKFRRELRLRETVTIETRCLSYKGKLGTIQQRILNSQNEVCAEAEFLFGLFDMVRRRLIPPTTEWLKAVGMSPEEDPTDFPFKD